MNNTTIFFTTFWGVFLMSTSIAFSLIPSLKYNLIDLVRDNKLRLTVSFLTISLGLTSIYFHNYWTYGMTGLVTLFGWICLAKGITIAAVPMTIKLSDHIANSRWFGLYLLCTFFLGWYMLLYGYNTPLNP